MTQFSPDRNPAPSGTSHRLSRNGPPHGKQGGGGSQGAQAAPKPHKGQQQGQQPGGHRIGRPAPPQPPEQAPAPPPETADQRHIHLLARYANMQALGRQQSFGLWALQNGHGPDLLQPGQAPFDFLEDS